MILPENSKMEELIMLNGCYGYLCGGTDFPFIAFLRNPYLYYLKICKGYVNLITILIEDSL